MSADNLIIVALLTCDTVVVSPVVVLITKSPTFKDAVKSAVSSFNLAETAYASLVPFATSILKFI